MTIVFEDKQRTLDVQKVEYCYKNRGFAEDLVKLTAAYVTNTDNLAEVAQELESLFRSEEFTEQMRLRERASVYKIEVTEKKSGEKPFFEVNAELTTRI